MKNVRRSAHEQDLWFATEQARAAGQLLVASFGRVQRVDRKSKRDVVTEVDVASEELILGAIRERYPSDAILAEESGHHLHISGEKGSASDRTWVVDPLDGTVNYANGIPHFCVSVALVGPAGPIVGVVLDPMRGDCYAATADGVATLNDEPVTSSDKEELSDFVVSLAVIGRGGIGRERRIGRAVRIYRRMGSAALGLAYVANARFDAFVQNGGLSAWDVAAAGLIAERSGATVSDLSGGPWWAPERRPSAMSIVAAPSRHHGTLLELLASVGTTVKTRR